jgi:protein-tyrosine phosphatase
MPRSSLLPPGWAGLLAYLGLSGTGACAAPAPIPFESAEVSLGADHNFSIVWHAPGVRHVTVYATTDPERTMRDKPVAEAGGAAEVTVSGLAVAPRWYFVLVPDHGTQLVLADRSLHLTTAANFRDVGGYRTADGKWVRMGVAYRSNELDHLTDPEIALLNSLHLRLVCDLRTQEEIRRGADKTLASAQQISADVLADDASKIHALMSAVPQSDAAKRRANMSAFANVIYRDFVRAASARQAYHLLFTKLADPAALPEVFHCSAGKDRSGWAAAVLLTILHVPRATILRDYELTELYLKGEALRNLQAHFQSAQALSVDPKDLNNAFDEVTVSFGSFDAYLHRGLGLDDATLEEIRRNFLAG